MFNINFETFYNEIKNNINLKTHNGLKIHYECFKIILPFLKMIILFVQVKLLKNYNCRFIIFVNIETC